MKKTYETITYLLTAILVASSKQVKPMENGVVLSTQTARSHSLALHDELDASCAAENIEIALIHLHELGKTSDEHTHERAQEIIYRISTLFSAMTVAMSRLHSPELYAKRCHQELSEIAQLAKLSAEDLRAYNACAAERMLLADELRAEGVLHSPAHDERINDSSSPKCTSEARACDVPRKRLFSDAPHRLATAAPKETSGHICASNFSDNGDNYNLAPRTMPFGYRTPGEVLGRSLQNIGTGDTYTTLSPLKNLLKEQSKI